MPGKLEVSFNSPQCGWMSIGFEDGLSEFHTTTAHAPHEFALSELLKILTTLLGDAAVQNEYTLKWNRDPEAYDFHFHKDGGRLTIQIDQYPTDEREAAMRESVFLYTGNLRETCLAFAATFEQLHADRETDEFEFNWRQPFPFREYEEFKQSIEC